MDVHAHKDPNGYFLSCVDPGGDTGMALLHIKPDTFQLIDTATVPYRPALGEDPIKTLTSWVRKHPGVHHLLYESFHIRNTAAAASTDLTPVEVIKAMQDMVANGNAYEAVFSQQPVGGKHMASDDVLEKLGLHMGHKHAQRHVRDALRHAVTHLARQRYAPLCRVAFPRRSVRSLSPGPGSRP